MKKSLRILIVVPVLILLMQLPASASLQDNLVPQDTDKGSVGEVQLEYNEYPQHHYELDTYVDTSGDWMPWNWADGAGKQIYIALMEIINAIWLLNVLLANFTMVIVQEAFELDFVSNVIDQIAAAIQNIAGFNAGGFMNNGLWPLLVTFILCIVGSWAAYVGMIKRESSRAWGGLVSALIIFVFSLGFFSNASKILGGMNDWSSELQSDILAISSSIVNPGSSYSKEEGIATIRNQMFDLMVKKPYMLMQYGTTEVYEERVNKMLEIDPILKAEEREEAAKNEVENEENAMMSIDGITQRAAFVPLLFLGNSIIGVFLLMISGSIILFQLIFLVLALFAPVPLLMALVPRWQQTAVDWAMKLLHAQLMKIAIALLLTILFGISAILYRATESSDMGYLGMMILQIICFVGIWAKRKDLFSMVSTAANNVQSSTGQTLQSYRQKYNQARNMARTGKDMLDQNNSRGRIRNQPLAQRNIGFLNKDQLAKRQKQLQSTKDALVAAAGTISIADRNNPDFKDGQDDRIKNRTRVDNAAADREQLMDRRAEGIVNQNGSVTSIGELRRRRSEGRNLANAPLLDRQGLQDASRESAAAMDRSEMRDVDLADRSQSQRNINLMDQHSHEDRINEKQRNINDTVSRQVINNEGNERNIQETTNRNFITNENNERTVNNVIERNNNVTETYRRVQENMTEKESVSKDVIRRNEQNVRENVSTINHVNREQVNETINRENVNTKNIERE